MSINKYQPHVWLIPEDDANRQIAVGFRAHGAVDVRRVGISDPAGGWGHVCDVFETEFVPYLRAYQNGHVVMLIDFDEQGEARRSACAQRIPDDLMTRVFLIGSMATPEQLRAELSMSYERIGETLARDCSLADLGRWCHPHLSHNLDELRRMVPILRPIIFQGD